MAINVLAQNLKILLYKTNKYFYKIIFSLMFPNRKNEPNDHIGGS